MRTFTLTALAIAMFAVGASAQHVIDVTDFEFVDSVSGTNVTTIELGETIEFNWVSGFHLMQDGEMPGAPGAGGLFSFPIDPANTSFLFTPTEVGCLDYFCFPHFFLNMVGVINVEPAVLPGSGEDYDLTIEVNGVEGLIATPGDLVTMQFGSPLGTFNGGEAVLIAQVYANNTTGPGSPGGFPEAHVNTFGAFVIFGDTLSPFGTPYLIQPGGYTLSTGVPPSFVGFTARIQAFALTGLANNTFFATSDAKDIFVK